MFVAGELPWATSVCWERAVVSGAILFSGVNPLNMALKALALFQSCLWQILKLTGRICIYWYEYGSLGTLLKIFSSYTRFCI